MALQQRDCAPEGLGHQLTIMIIIIIIIEENPNPKVTDFFLCLILTASRVFCDFSSFSVIPPHVTSSLHDIPIRLVKARVFLSLDSSLLRESQAAVTLWEMR